MRKTAKRGSPHLPLFLGVLFCLSTGFTGLFAEVDAEELAVLAAGRGHLDNGLYGTLRFLHGRARHRNRCVLQLLKRVG